MIRVNFDKGNGLVPVIVQDVQTGAVLMLAYMNEESLRMTMAWMNRESLEISLREKKTCFYSRSRQELWIKGETSGHYQYVKDIRIDCDEDTILLLVEQVGAACHTGHTSCFYRNMEGEEI